MSTVLVIRLYFLYFLPPKKMVHSLSLFFQLPHQQKKSSFGFASLISFNKILVHSFRHQILFLQFPHHFFHCFSHQVLLLELPLPKKLVHSSIHQFFPSAPLPKISSTALVLWFRFLNFLRRNFGPQL